MRNRSHLFFLFRQLTGRELAARYRSTTLGVVWLILQPLLMLGVYTLVFGTIFSAKWGGARSTADFSLVLFSGLLIFNLFSEVFLASPSVIVGQPNYVKKVVFPVELLGGVKVATALSTAAIAWLILLMARIAIMGVPSPLFLLSPLVLLEMVPMLLGIAWLLSSLGVYLKDIAQVVGIVTSMILFLSPIFFPADAMPESFRGLILFNPLATPIDAFRKLTIMGEFPDLTGLMNHFALSVLFMAFSYLMFKKLAKGFADVL